TRTTWSSTSEPTTATWTGIACIMVRGSAYGSLIAMRDELRELWRYRELLLVMVRRDLKIRYKNSALGIFWSFLNPLLQVGVMTFVFGTILNRGVDNFSAYILAAYLPFTFFQFAVLDSAQSVLAQLPLVKKIYFPREILPIASVLANFLHLLLGFVVLFAFLLIAYLRNPQVIPFQATTIYLPILLLISLMLSLGLGLIISALNTYFEDVKFIASMVMYLMVFLCPIMYLAEEVAATGLNHRSHFLLYKIYNLNPMAALATAYRKVLLAPVPVPIAGRGVQAPLPLEWDYIGIAAVVSFVTLVGGYALFNRLKWGFVERP
ncbi:ABC transporter permease, partial [bacterium]